MQNSTPKLIQAKLPLVKLCKCGCGQPAPIAKKTRTSLGHVKGEPIDFINGHNRRVAPIKRFWANVDKNGPIHPVLGTRCWIWTGDFGNHGYGRIRDRFNRMGAHRFSYELHYGSIPEGDGFHGTCILHKCDRRSCVRPDHLFTGTQTDNFQDMIAKGRAHWQHVP